jgi:hypothetical protein
MRFHTHLIAFGLLSGCWYERARPAKPIQPTPEPIVETSASYRATTIAVDVIGVAAMTAGLVGLQRGASDDVSGGFLVAGTALAGYATSIIHLAHGNKARAGGSFLIRSISATTGMLIGMGVAGCEREDLTCNLVGMAWGVAGGLAVGSALDALLLHDNPAEQAPRTWTPTVTAGEGGARVGVLGAF